MSVTDTPALCREDDSSRIVFCRLGKKSLCVLCQPAGPARLLVVRQYTATSAAAGACLFILVFAAAQVAFFWSPPLFFPLFLLRVVFFFPLFLFFDRRNARFLVTACVRAVLGRPRFFFLYLATERALCLSEQGERLACCPVVWLRTSIERTCALWRLALGW